MVRIRMKSLGRRHRPFFRICAMDARSPRDGRAIEELGHHDPMVRNAEARTVLKKSRIRYWLSVGAQPSEKVQALLKRYGVMKPAPGEPWQLPDLTHDEAPLDLSPPAQQIDSLRSDFGPGRLAELRFNEAYLFHGSSQTANERFEALASWLQGVDKRSRGELVGRLTEIASLRPGLSDAGLENRARFLRWFLVFDPEAITRLSWDLLETRPIGPQHATLAQLAPDLFRPETDRVRAAEAFARVAIDLDAMGAKARVGHELISSFANLSPDLSPLRPLLSDGDGSRLYRQLGLLDRLLAAAQEGVRRKNLDWVSQLVARAGSSQAVWAAVALQILIKYRHCDVVGLAARLLDARPLSEAHSTLVELIPTTLPDMGDDPRALLADALEGVADEAFARPAPEASQVRRLMRLKSVRAMAAFDPKRVPGLLTRHLAHLDEALIIPMLEAATDAATRFRGDVKPGSSFRTFADGLWRQWAGPAHQADPATRAGVLCRALELLGRCGEALAARLDEIRDPVLESRVLFLLINRPLDFLPEAERKACFDRALRVLEERGQVIAVEKVRERMGASRRRRDRV